MKPSDAQFSRAVSQLLRHDARAEGLSPSPEGWVEIDAVIEALHRSNPDVPRYRVDDFSRLLDGPKVRHEIEGMSIRATHVRDR